MFNQNPIKSSSTQIENGTSQNLSDNTAREEGGISGAGSVAGQNSKTKKKLPISYLVGALLLVMVVIGLIAGLFLTQTGQDIRQQASITGYCAPEGGSIDLYGACCAGLVVGPDGTTCRKPSAPSCAAEGQNVDSLRLQWGKNFSCCSGLVLDGSICKKPSTTLTCSDVGVGGCLNGSICTVADVVGSRSATGGSCTSPAGTCTSGQAGQTKCETNREYRCISVAPNAYYWQPTGNRCGPAAGDGQDMTICCRLPNGSYAMAERSQCNEDLGYIPQQSHSQCLQTTPTDPVDPGTGGPTTPPTTQCVAANNPCNDDCCDGLVCQGRSGNRICQDPGIHPDDICGDGYTCSNFLSFTCDNGLHTSATSNGALVCEKNAAYHQTDRAAAIARVENHGCGQWDQVCNGGPKANQLCGDFGIVDRSCTSTTTDPVDPGTEKITYSCNSTCETDAQCQTADSRFSCVQSGNVKRCRLASNPTNTDCQPAVGPMCMSVTLNNITRPNAGTSDPRLGEQISITCGIVPGVTQYAFRIVQPGGVITNLQAIGGNQLNTSVPFTISSTGRFFAQCQICPDGSCNAFESLTQN